jgi:hypothetical protein
MFTKNSLFESSIMESGFINFEIIVRKNAKAPSKFQDKGLKFRDNSFIQKSTKNAEPSHHTIQKNSKIVKK